MMYSNTYIHEGCNYLVQVRESSTVCSMCDTMFHNRYNTIRKGTNRLPYVETILRGNVRVLQTSDSRLWKRYIMHSWKRAHMMMHRRICYEGQYCIHSTCFNDKETVVLSCRTIYRANLDVRCLSRFIASKLKRSQ
jgi:hypothetical protein